MQQLALALLFSLGVTGLLVLLIGFLQRRVRLVRLLAFPLWVASFGVGLAVFRLLGARGAETLDRFLPVLFAFLAAIVFVRIASIFFFEVHLRSRRGHRVPPLLPNVTTWVLYFITAVVALKVFYPEFDFRAIAATSAVTSLVLGLALQPILGNFFAGMVISLERPFRINDWVQFGDTEGRVVDITWRTTHLRTRDNDNLVIPNGRISDEPIVNYHYPHRLHLERIYVGVHYRTPPYRVKQALLDAASRTEGVLEKPSPEVYLNSFDDSAITYELRIWLEDFAHKPRIASHARSEIWEEFTRRDITIPFPIRTLEIEPRAGTLQIERRRAAAAAGRDGEAEPYPARLFVAWGSDRGRSKVLTGDRVTLGRSNESDFRIMDRNASKLHASIEWTDEGYVLTDLGSRFGTRIGGQRVEHRVLRNLDRIEVGETVLVFEKDD